MHFRAGLRVINGSRNYSSADKNSPVSSLISAALSDQSTAFQKPSLKPATYKKAAEKVVPRKCRFYLHMYDLSYFLLILGQFTTALIYTSPQKALLVARMLKNMTLRQAITQLEFNKKKTAPFIRGTLNRGFASIRHNTLYAINEKNAQVAQPPATTDHLEISHVLVNKGQYRKDIRIHGRGRCGIVYHPSCRVKITLQEILDEEKVARDAKLTVGRSKSELEKLVYAMKKHRLYRTLRDEKPIIPLNAPWSRKPWKYVTSKRWTNPNFIKIKR